MAEQIEKSRDLFTPPPCKHTETKLAEISDPRIGTELYEICVGCKEEIL